MITFSWLGRYGRLGNQMFQYAALLGVAARTGYDYGVDHAAFEISQGFEITPGRPADGTRRAVYREAHHHFDPGVFDIADDTDLVGFFQTERYFEHCLDLVRQEYRFKTAIRERCEARIDRLRDDGCELVSVHVRRGDYLGMPWVPVCTPRYYLRAMMLLARRGPCKFLVFSDDPPWCRENMDSPVLRVIETGSHFEDLCLMSLCDHHIIANSTFGWWGAWLDARPEKVVIAPETWFGPRDTHLSTRDLYCEGWIRL